jgi:hypothetical protein
MIGPDGFARTIVRWWRCIPCGATNGDDPFCCVCGRSRGDATNADRWALFFLADAIIVDIPCDDCGRIDGTHNPDVEH